ncbi:hypothetical protein [Rubripirellula reticaptiva]|uniref:Uncharacterized protein n=1 Tax=Rubripirellula reticaptiva TaxID=2528013 RepID=A0A5C6F8E2_9BACT|nr:hypothetical protein [Rubripirellula reticaptiva]TWU55989.1 hypothetical protein Poly59_22920 [Rubripirellula reticaptiva]
MFFPQQYWWDSAAWQVPDGVKYLSERWWELLKDWHCITSYSLPSSFCVSVLEDIAEVLDDLQGGRLRSCHQLDALYDELGQILSSNLLLAHAFPAEVNATVETFKNLYDSLPASPQDKYAELKKRHKECRRAAAAARRLHHRCFRRRATEDDMTWTGYGGLAAMELCREVAKDEPSYNRLDTLVEQLLLDCVYRGYNADYLTSLLDRYLPMKSDLRDGMLHMFRRLSSLKRHRYKIYFVVDGATDAEIRSSELRIDQHTKQSVEDLKSKLDEGRSAPTEIESEEGEIADADDVDEGTLSAGSVDVDEFLSQLDCDQLILSMHWQDSPDAGAAADDAKRRLQEIIDFLDFQSPMQRYDLHPKMLVTWEDRNGKLFARTYPDDSAQQPPQADYAARIDPNSAGKLSGLAEALRWSAVARREKTPEVSLLASWFAFEYLAGTVERTAVEGIVSYFPKVIAIGNVRRRLLYWWSSFAASPGFQGHEKKDALIEIAVAYRNRPNLSGIATLLYDSAQSSPNELGQAVLDIASQSVLLRHRTKIEGKRMANHQVLAHTVQDDDKEIRRELSQFLMIRNKLVHRARIDHPLLTVVSDRAKNRLYDLLRDLSVQLTAERIDGSVDEVLIDYRDTFDELLDELGSGPIDMNVLIQRISLA